MAVQEAEVEVAVLAVLAVLEFLDKVLLGVREILAVVMALPVEVGLEVWGLIVQLQTVQTVEAAQLTLLELA
jgi:hypothetical protein